MPLTRRGALEVLGLPPFASDESIIERYKYLALEWFPEKHNKSAKSIEIFGNVTKATIALLESEKDFFLDLKDMYHFFQYIFFGGRDRQDKDSDDDSWDTQEDSGSSFDSCDEQEFQHHLENVVREELEVAANASALIHEEAEEKAKSERRKAKKKRRKERKKLEKKDQNTENSTPSNKLTNGTSARKGRTEVLKSESDEDLDPASAFVSVVAKKHRKQLPNLAPKQEEKVFYHQNGYQPELPEENEEDPQIVIEKARELAYEGNNRANAGKYAQAVDLFSQSIKLDPSDHRFYGNRSYCYDRLEMFDKALKDAEKAIKLCPLWPKGYYRKGRALIGQRKFALAEKYFIEVLKRDNDCEDAISELRKAKILQITEKGYSKEVAEAALSRHTSVSEAIESLLASGVSRMMTNDVDIYISDDEIKDVDKPFKPVKSKPTTTTKPTPAIPSNSPFYDIKRDPRNPEGHNSIWIGNVQDDVTEKKLTSMFGKFGELMSIKVMPEKHCAFVNYKHKSSPGKAMEAYQGFELSGYNLLVRFPNLPGEVSAPTPAKTKPGVIGQENKKQGAVNGNECYFWRTTGCVYGEMCRYKHIKEHRGIDKKNWQVV